MPPDLATFIRLALLLRDNEVLVVPVSLPGAAAVAAVLAGLLINLVALGLLVLC